MTTGRINQVTTFRPAFAVIVHSRAPKGSLSRCGVHQHFRSEPIAAQGHLPPKQGVGYNHPQTNEMASPHFPFSHVLSKIPLSRKKQRSPTFDEDYLNDLRCLKGSLGHGGSPSVLTASGLTIGKQSTSFKRRPSPSPKQR
jgi:hypothetical protein